MKKQILGIVLLVLGLAYDAQAQWTSETSTNSVYLTNTADKLGLGVITPLERLHINGAIRGSAAGGALRISSQFGYIDIGPQDATLAHFSTDRAGFVFVGRVFISNGLLSSQNTMDLKLQTAGVTQLTVARSSNIGIGTENPQAKLHVAGPLLLESAAPAIYTAIGPTDQNRYLQIANSPALALPAGLKSGGMLVADAYSYANPDKNTLIVKGAVGIGTDLASNPNGYTLLVNGKVSAPSFYINDKIVVSSQWVTAGENVYFPSGVGIGTSLTDNPKGYKLAVAGKIGAKDVRVENSSNTWPDYVFDAAYELPSLDSVAFYIKTHGHLQDVPSAGTIQKEGHELGAMDAVLLKKIEELTLYMLQLKAENEQLRERVMILEKK